MAMAFQIGAALGTDDEWLLAQIANLGYHVGIVAQLLNDIEGVDPNADYLSSDIRLRKKTLPIAYAIACATEEDITAIRTWAEGTTALTHAEAKHLAALIYELGGIHYTWVVADTHRHEALTLVDTIATQTGRDELRELHRLIPTIQARRQ